MEIRKNDTFTVRIEDMSEDGAGIGRLDGYIWFIKDTVPGDVVEAGAMKRKKTYGFARLLRILTPSADRIEPRCPVAKQCGGCQLQAMRYEAQLRFKEKKVRDSLVRIGGLDEASFSFEPIIGMEEPWRYRNKAQFPFGENKEGGIIAGFYAGRTHTIIEQEDCLLGAEENREILTVIREHMKKYQSRPYDEKTHQGLLRHVLIRKGFCTGELMVCLVVNGRRLPGEKELVEDLGRIKGMTSISYNVNTEKTNVILGRELINLYGPGYVTDFIGALRYRISPLAFYQVNPVQTEKLYALALEYAGLTGEETVWDLYCGIGTISLFLAQRAKFVYGVEAVPEAVRDARENARLNGIENVRFFEGKAEEILPEQYETNRIHADVVVVDPPRKGCDAACLDTILRLVPKRIVYVSCGPATLARDLKVLAAGGYEVRRARCVDMFAWGVHVETVVLLTNASVGGRTPRDR